jgi:hypothetical protein
MPEREHQPYPQLPEHLTLQSITETAKEALLRDGDYQPALYAEGNEHLALIQIGRLLEHFEERAEHFFSMGALLALEQYVGELRQVFFVSEAWLSTASREERDFLPPSQDPNRVEVLIIAQMNASDASSSFCVIEMRRDGDGKLTELQELKSSENVPDVLFSPLLAAFITGFLMKRDGEDEVKQ